MTEKKQETAVRMVIMVATKRGKKGEVTGKKTRAKKNGRSRIAVITKIRYFSCNEVGKKKNKGEFNEKKLTQAEI